VRPALIDDGAIRDEVVVTLPPSLRANVTALRRRGSGNAVSVCIHEKIGRDARLLAERPPHLQAEVGRREGDLDDRPGERVRSTGGQPESRDEPADDGANAVQFDVSLPRACLRQRAARRNLALPGAMTRS
jgi:hypothetical protein